MRARLLHRDRDVDLGVDPPPMAEALRQDLELDVLFAAMGADDAFLIDLAPRVVLAGLREHEEIHYRQDVLRDALDHPDVVRRIYAIAADAITGQRRIPRSIVTNSPERTLRRSVQLLEFLLGALRSLREVADEHGAAFRSEGLRRFVAMIADELDDAYLERVEHHLAMLRFRHGVLVSAQLGRGNRGVGYVLRGFGRPPGWKDRLVALARPPGCGFRVADRDEGGQRALSELRDQGLNLVANAVAQSADHVLAFLAAVRAEAGFYVACLNLHERLTEHGAPVCFPDPCPPGRPRLEAEGLLDPCLSLAGRETVVGNDVAGTDASLVMITGANRGGKSTFLRSVGLAQLMMQSGMFVAARSFAADVRGHVFTHFKREEDATMERGKLDEELSRMSEIADQLAGGDLVLFNESFAATNEREGSEIARQVIDALRDAGVKVVFVTHMFDLAHGCYIQGAHGALFLRAERSSDGERTFRLLEGEPLSTSYGEDIYRRVFGAAPSSMVRPAR